MLTKQSLATNIEADCLVISYKVVMYMWNILDTSSILESNSLLHTNLVAHSLCTKQEDINVTVNLR